MKRKRLPASGDEGFQSEYSNGNNVRVRYNQRRRGNRRMKYQEVTEPTVYELL